MKSGAVLRFSSPFSAAAVVTTAVVATATTATAAAAPAPTAATAENDDNQQNDPTAVTAPTIVSTAHKNSPHQLFGGCGITPSPPCKISYAFTVQVVTSKAKLIP